MSSPNHQSSSPPSAKRQARKRRYALPFLAAMAGGFYYAQDTIIGDTRYALPIEDARFEAPVTEVVYTEQNWSPSDSVWFYTVSQGSNLLPYDIFLALEQAHNQQLFRDNQHLNQYRYLTQQASWENPDGLPVGWAKDTYQNKDYLGFTCAACHTAQLNYQQHAIRIDGGPALADMESLLEALAQALRATLDQPEKQERLLQTVKRPAKEVKADLIRYTALMEHYVSINHPLHRIQLNTPMGGSQDIALQETAPRSLASKDTAKDNTQETLHVAYGYGRLDAFGRIYNRLLAHLTPDNPNNYNSPNAPVSIPHLWDTPHHDFVQWNGVGDNEGQGSLGRNTGEVMGVFATMDLSKKRGLAGYRSSVNARNIIHMERQLKYLWSPQWQELSDKQILPAIDAQLAEQGSAVFTDYQCHTCHTAIDRSHPERQVTAQLSSLQIIGTDPAMANNALQPGLSGYFEAQNIHPFKSSHGTFKQQESALKLLSSATAGVMLEADHDMGWLRRWLEKGRDLINYTHDNPVKNTQKHLDFDVVDKADTNTLLAYKARPLNGIWATAPYLHNGSVRSLYELLIPACDSTLSAPPVSATGYPECRSVTFTVGSRDFDPNMVGFVSPPADNHPHLNVFDTRLPSNSNRGHEYAAGNTPIIEQDSQGRAKRNAQGELVLRYLPPMNHSQRIALVEYLKTL